MAIPVQVGSSDPKFGFVSTHLNIMFWDSKEYDEETDKEEVTDENNRVIAAAYSKNMEKVSLSGTLRTLILPKAGDVLDIDHPSHGLIKVVVDKAKMTEQKGQFMTGSIECTYYPDMELS